LAAKEITTLSLIIFVKIAQRTELIFVSEVKRPNEQHIIQSNIFDDFTTESTKAFYHQKSTVQIELELSRIFV
jgi:hypothetical protein